MNKTLYTKKNKKNTVKKIRLFGLGIAAIGCMSLLYFSFPLLSWKFYFEPVFASNAIQAPIPQTTVVTKTTLQSLVTNAVQSTNVDFTNATNWFPQYRPPKKVALENKITAYNISIPKLDIRYAHVSTIDTDLSSHLIHYTNTPLPPEKGNAVIFGHSTLPQLFKATDYKTIFANLHTLEPSDIITVTIEGKEYTYRVESLTITTPDDTTVFTQDINKSYITLITCTPPGTTWKRLIVKAALVKH